MLKLCTVILALAAVALATPTPIALLHGMGDSAYNPLSMEAVEKHLKEELPGLFVYSTHTGNNIVTDTLSGFIGNLNDQVESMCKIFPTIPEFANGFDILGFSQGGQMGRAYVQRCNNPPVKKLITFGGQHMGVADIPGCLGTNATLCQLMTDLLSIGAYAPGVRDVSIQAQYFADPMKKAEYIERNIFLPDINNELEKKNPVYKERLVTLEKLVLIKFTKDFVVIPNDSSWFQYYPWGTLDRKQIPAFNETEIYKADNLGLRELHTAKKIDFLEAPFMHMKFTLTWLDEHIVNVYLK